MPEVSTPLRITARELPPEEWGRLSDLPIAQNLPSPENAAILVVEQDGCIVAVWAAMTMIHLDGCFIRPEARKHYSVVTALINGMSRLLNDRGLPEVLTFTQADEVGDLARRLGGEPLGQLWRLPVPFHGVS